MRTLVGKVMSLLFNVLPGFVITFLLSSKRLLISGRQSLSVVILDSKKIGLFLLPLFPLVLGPDAMILGF